jgi:fatty-acyl-CoA synthase
MISPMVTPSLGTGSSVSGSVTISFSSIEVEGALYRHPAVLEAAVAAMPDEKWGEVPCAFVTLRDDNVAVSEQDIIDYCRDNMAHFKAPKKVVFGDLPKTATGKIKKFELRERAKQQCLRGTTLANIPKV